MAELPYWPSEAGISGNGSNTSIGLGRLYIYESAIDPDSNTSSVTVEYQLKCSVSGSASSSYSRFGEISIEGTNKSLKASSIRVTVNNTWTQMWSATWANIPHDTDGSKTITITVASTTGGNYGSGGACLYLGSGSTRRTNSTGKGTFTFELTKFDVGTPVYIGGVEYYCYIGNEDGTWSAADPVIG